MIWILADALPQATRGEISSWIIGGAAVMSAVAIYKTVFPTRKPPLEAEFLSREEFKEFKAEVKQDMQAVQTSVNVSLQKLTDKIGDMHTEVLTAGERRSGELHEKINGIGKQVAAINERTKNL